jgi:hypothetical protein
MTLHPGDQLASAVCSTRVVVVRAPAQAAPAITCGGSPMTPAPATRPAAPDDDCHTLIGKRYVDADGQVELLCTFSGAGELACDGIAMTIRAAKPLPASD